MVYLNKQIKISPGMEVDGRDIHSYVEFMASRRVQCFAVEEKMEPVAFNVAFRDYNSETFYKTSQLFMEVGLVNFWYSLVSWKDIMETNVMSRKNSNEEDEALTDRLSSKVMTIFSLCGLLVGLISVLVLLGEILWDKIWRKHNYCTNIPKW